MSTSTVPASATLRPDDQSVADDHLGLLERPLGASHLLVFTGMSGSGKSTYIDLLLSRHDDFRDRPVDRLGPWPIDWSDARPSADLVVVDEVHSPLELLRVDGLLRDGRTVLLASHLHPAWTRPLGMRWRVERFRTDAGTAKLTAELDRRGVHWTPAAIDDFAREYGASYTELDIILELTRVDDFDVALHRFRRMATITRRRVARVSGEA